MVVADPIAGFSTCVRNANQTKHEVPEVPAPNIKKGTAEALKCEGFVKNVEAVEDDKQGTTRIFPKHEQSDEHAIINLRRISKSGLRVCAKREDIPKALNGLGAAIVSTSEGLLTGKEAHRKNAGGEIIACV